MLRVLFGTNMFVGGALAFLLDNTIPGQTCMPNNALESSTCILKQSLNVHNTHLVNRVPKMCLQTMIFSSALLFFDGFIERLLSFFHLRCCPNNTPRSWAVPVSVTTWAGAQLHKGGGWIGASTLRYRGGWMEWFWWITLQRRVDGMVLVTYVTEEGGWNGSGELRYRGGWMEWF